MKKGWQKRYFKENEIFQLGFRLANKSGNSKIYAMDYEAEMRFDLFTEKAKEIKTINPSAFDTKIKELNDRINTCIKKRNMEDVYTCLNSEDDLKLNKAYYISVFNRLNKSPDYYGSDLVAGWYRRNLIMFSTIQNTVSDDDKNIVVIVGIGHAPMLQEFIKLDERFNLIKISDIF